MGALLLFTAEYYSTVHIHGILFTTHQLRDAQVVSRLLLFLIMLLWTRVYMFFCEHMFPFLLGILWGVNCWVICYSVFNSSKKLSHCFSKQLHPFTFPPNNAWRFQFIYILANTHYYSFFYYIHCIGCDEVWHLSFDFHFLKWLMMLSILWQFISLLYRKMSIQSSALKKNQLVFL